MSDTPDEFVRARAPQRIKAPKEPPKIPSGTWVQVCPDDPELSTWGKVVMCLPRARVEISLRNGARLTVARYLIRVP